MADGNSVVPLSRLSRGFCTYYLVVKVGRIIYKEVLRYGAASENPVKEQVAIHLVVFDKEV